MTVTYNTDKLTGGEYTSRQVALAADTYYMGMPLQYNFTVPTTGTADAGNTGDGTATVVSQAAGQKLLIGTYTIECTSVVTNGGIFKVTDPNSVDIATNLVMIVGSGAATAFVAGGLDFTLTDGATDFAASDKFTVAVSAGTFAYLSTGTLGGFYLGPDTRVLSSAGTGDIINGGEVNSAGVVNDSNVTLTIDAGQNALWANLGFYIKG